MHRLGIPTDIMASNLDTDWKAAKKYSQDAELPNAIRRALDGGLSPAAIAKKRVLPEPLVWSVVLENRDDLDCFDALGWKLRPWDYWFWSDCLPR